MRGDKSTKWIAVFCGAKRYRRRKRYYSKNILAGFKRERRAFPWSLAFRFALTSTSSFSTTKYYGKAAI